MDKAYEWSNKELIDILLNENKLIVRLKSIKRYFLLECGDLFVHFLDSCESELDKHISLISVEKLQSLLDMSVRVSSADNDTYCDEVSCYLSSSSYGSILSSLWSLNDRFKDIMNIDNMISSDSIHIDIRNIKQSKDTKGSDHLSLDYNVEWPLNLILSQSNMIYYKLIFKHVFMLKYTEYKLYKCWMNNQVMKQDKLSPGCRGFFLLLNRMMLLIRNILYNHCNEIIEDHWKTMITNIQQVGQSNSAESEQV